MCIILLTVLVRGLMFPISRKQALTSIKMQALAPDDRRHSVLHEAAERHAQAGLGGVGSGDYMGEHWLGSFALYLLGCMPQQEAP